MKTNIQTVAVLGGGGRTGQYLIQQLLDQGLKLRILLRHPEHFQFKSPLIEIIKGDAADLHSIENLLKDCNAVIGTIGQRPGEQLIARQATENILKTMHAEGIKRYILVAGINIDTPSDQKGQSTLLATNWMKENYPEIQTDRQNAYTLLTQSEADWTMVRVPMIEFSAQKTDFAIDLADCLGQQITACNIASFLTEQLPDTQFYRKSPFISNI
ncbi:NAD(P)-binding oxidoreductase [Pedobacter antarcticus]|uniref:NAD(P)-dependent oxidoreductase n=1 Tax=Pedobacter antarcticus TaxID=34086 RepID=UPI00292DAF51|nr:NAD(P)-binding oxidoreductase [Pedobacter antarcticus]